MCEKKVYEYSFTSEFVPGCHKNEEMCKKVVSKEPFT